MYSILLTLDDEDWIGRWGQALPESRLVRMDRGPLAAADALVRAATRLAAPAILIGRGATAPAVLRAAQAGAAAGVLLIAPECDDVILPLPVPVVVIADHGALAAGVALAAALGGEHVDGGDLAAAARAEEWGYGRFVLNWLTQRIADTAMLTPPSCRANVVSIASGTAGRLRHA